MIDHFGKVIDHLDTGTQKFPNPKQGVPSFHPRWSITCILKIKDSPPELKWSITSLWGDRSLAWCTPKWSNRFQNELRPEPIPKTFAEYSKHVNQLKKIIDSKIQTLHICISKFISVNIKKLISQKTHCYISESMVKNVTCFFLKLFRFACQTNFKIFVYCNF